MVDYKLAKQLKDVGFPQDLDRDPVWCREKKTQDQPPFLLLPTLSELIDACQKIKEDFGLNVTHHPSEEFMARGYKDLANKVIWHATDDGYETNTEGKTPSEAVAKLYIALNKKDA